MAWVLLTVAGLLEVVWAAAMKASDGFTRVGPTILMVVAMGISIWMLAYAMRSLPLGTAYAVWVGIGALGAFIVGIGFWNEPVNALRIGSAALILLGIIGLKVSA
ncbi:MAG: multidrug efflux SMR transporter [Rhodospirillales bacterium]|nr:multidrug efflux SMR transporter [Rhodospirillales bacterium]